MKRVALLLALVLASCVPPIVITPTRPVSPPITPTSPVSPPITPTPPEPIVPPVPPTMTPRPRAAYAELQNSDFEGVFTVRGNAVTVAQYWQPWWLSYPPCKPGATGCAIPCPKNCATCPAKDKGCYWADPEFAAAYKPDYNPPRAHGGNWAQKFFVYGRQGQGGLYQQVQVSARSLLTFTAWFEAWQCFDSDHCSLTAVRDGGSKTDPPPDPARAAFLMAQWGCTDWQVCKFWTASDRPYQMHMKVGIDPTGGISPTAASVIWGKEIESFDYWSQASVTATTEGAGAVTVFTYGAPRFDFARLNNDIYVDSTELTITAIEPAAEYKFYLPNVAR